MTSCYSLETVDSNEYISFLNKIKSSHPTNYGALPKLEDIGCIEEMYLYYTDKEIIDTMYTIYLNCVYGQDEL